MSRTVFDGQYMGHRGAYVGDEGDGVVFVDGFDGRQSFDKTLGQGYERGIRIWLCMFVSFECFEISSSFRDRPTTYHGQIIHNGRLGEFSEGIRVEQCQSR